MLEENKKRQINLESKNRKNKEQEKKLKKFKITNYEITSEKISQKLRFVMISDWHNVVFGERNEPVFKAIHKINPDAILIAGDLVLGKQEAPLLPALESLKELIKAAPVFYAPGNHEQRMKCYPQNYEASFLEYETQIKKLGVHYLENEQEVLLVKGEKIRIYGLKLPYEYYKKGSKKAKTGPKAEELKTLLGEPDENGFHILLAHTPRYAKEYFNWGADLTLSGHYHGGILRLPFGGKGALSPDFVLFPKYCYGLFEKGEQKLITGSGLGEHTLPIRIANPRELVVISCKPKRK